MENKIGSFLLGLVSLTISGYLYKTLFITMSSLQTPEQIWGTFAATMFVMFGFCLIKYSYEK